MTGTATATAAMGNVDSAKVILSDYHEVERNLSTYSCQLVLLHQQNYSSYYNKD